MPSRVQLPQVDLAAGMTTQRRGTDTNEGRLSSAACSCFVLTVMVEIESEGAVDLLLLQCPVCLASWVREQS